MTKLAKAEGIEDPTDVELRNFDRKRKGRKTSNDDWQSPNDPDARITKMKDGTTHLAYKAEHAVDLESEIVTAANVQPADVGDGESIKTTVIDAQANLLEATGESEVREVAADKGYHKNETIAWCEERDITTFIAERNDGRRRWTNKPSEWKTAVYNNRRRSRRAKGKALQRRRSEVVERSFAHVCETGGSRRTWIRGIVEVDKRYLVAVMAHNLAVVLRKLFGVGKPREWKAILARLAAVWMSWMHLGHLLVLNHLARSIRCQFAAPRSRVKTHDFRLRSPGRRASSTGC